ncbi:indolepyruvate ferredoxin oxidoreductase family protein [Reyranella sp. CPCC 100927]|uniref:indolepyruvate ferredoxin oxidoreductase family protein n=1 Tax=Reyranella sp. CPCC 100927 TaxID=2599616 RepID=UPI0021026854|nr:indolepyruvate ferredoxin oxidoreductase family protein [Reyranella sp. CPCC 100927]
MAVTRPIAAATLDDKYALESGRVFLTGIQALVRLPMMQRQRDLAAGLNTGGYISGYRGSPLGGFDQALWQAKSFLEKNHIVFQPGVNEDLAATALWGTQQLRLLPGARYDGVFGMWYGKGPGVDRTGDVFKHANVNGTSQHGGVLALAGDDHTAKSSTVAHQSELAFIDAAMPVVNPASAQDVLDLGLHAFALSRYAGCWAGFKIVAELADSSTIVAVDPGRVSIVLPGDFEMPPGGLNLRALDINFQEQERRLHHFKLPAAQAYWRANGLDRVTTGGRGARLGIITAGKGYLDVCQALDDLGIDDAEAQRLGLAVYKVGLTWPIEPEGLRRFVDGLEQILVVEEKRPVMEPQIKDLLFNLPADRRPRVVGKTDESGAPLLPVTAELQPAKLAQVIAERLGVEHLPLPVSRRLALLARRQSAPARNAPSLSRPAYFCSGCPHNTSTRAPEGSHTMAGIGCHFMALWMDRDTLTYSQMGGEGAAWVGLSHFTDTPHVFQNLGDGTYFHSGYLALRQAVAANTNITYKILYNDAVAMTGGQRHDGDLTPWKISRQVHAEGVQRIALVSDDPDKYPPGLDWAPIVTFHHRRDLDEVQRDLREHKGVSVLIYDQTCAAEKRRRRKRGQFPDPARRVVINQAVCEGCGDCSAKSNCLSVVPIETEFGRKRTIDQSSCNKDYSCLEGFCPSFVTVEGGRLRKGKGDRQVGSAGQEWPDLPEPVLPSVAEQPYGILITGIGGTGVVTISALLGTAAHLEGLGASILDQMGMAQKGGAVMSHVRIARTPEAIQAVRLGTGGANLVLACDIAVAGYPDALSKVEQGTTRAVVNTHATITGDFTRHPDMKFPDQVLRLSIEAAAGADACDFLDAQALATALLGDSIATNLFMLGFAYQKGALPISAAALERAIELNGAAVAMNKQAFLWGRRAAHDLPAVQKHVRPVVAATEPAPLSRTLDEIVATRVKHLTAYQDAAYAQRYTALVDKVTAAEAARTPDATGLAEAVARGYAKLLAYKDEYEVARLYTDGTFLRQVHSQFEGDYKLKFHLAPPLLAERDARTGHLKKQVFGPFMMTGFAMLKRLKFLRGTRLDPFGRTEERRMERQLIGEYAALIAEILGKLSPLNHGIAVQLAALPDEIRGFGHVKDANLKKVRQKWAALLATFRNPEPLKQAAE